MEGFAEPEHYRCVIIMGSSDGVNNPGAENSWGVAPHEENVAGVNLRQKLLLRDGVETAEVDLVCQQPRVSLYFAPILHVGFRIADSGVLMMVYGRPNIMVYGVQSLFVCKLQRNSQHEFRRLDNGVALQGA